MNRVFVLILIALLQLRQFPCDCQGEGLLRPCNGDCTAPHAEDPLLDDASACCEDHQHNETAHHKADGQHHDLHQNSEDKCISDVLCRVRVDHAHSHPIPLCLHTSAARSIDRIRQTSVDFSLQLLGLVSGCELQCAPLIPPRFGIAANPETPWPVSTRQVLLCCWLI